MKKTRGGVISANGSFRPWAFLEGLCRPEVAGQCLDGRHVGREALKEDVVVVGVGDFEQGLVAGGGGVVQGLAVAERE